MAYVNLGLALYPVGSVYLSSIATSPASIWGGTWNQIADGRFLRPSNSFGSTGGLSSVTLSESNLPNHAHYLYGWPNKGSYAGHGVYALQDSTWGSIGYNNKMAQRYELNQAPRLQGSAFSVLNPYRTVYCWYRTA